MTRHSVLGIGSAAFHRLAYCTWGAPENTRVLICVHGLTRNGRDFDFLAAALEDRYRVLCPDVLGRGASGWLTQASRPAGIRMPLATSRSTMRRAASAGTCTSACSDSIVTIASGA